MDAFQAIVLGIVQGLTEFLPISSSGHLRIVPAFAGWEDPGAAFTAVIQIGTMAAVLLYFRKDLWNILTAWLKSLRDPTMRGTLEARLGWFIAIGTVPIVIFGFAFSSKIENGARGLYIIGTALIVFGLLLLAAERKGTHERDIDSLTMRDGVLIGLAQAAALVPGVSRSGATMTMGMFLGLNRAAAARYSFLLSVPAVVLSGVFELRNVGGEGSVGFAPTLIATLIAAVTGYLAIAWMLRFLTTHTTGIFVGYRVVLGVLVIALTASGAIS
jgi:undecaprenyl-diphosphatase